MKYSIFFSCDFLRISIIRLSLIYGHGVFSLMPSGFSRVFLEAFFGFFRERFFCFGLSVIVRNESVPVIHDVAI